MANRRFTRRSGGLKRRTSWEGNQLGFTLTTGTVAAATLVSEAILEEQGPGTVVRVRGRLQFKVSAVGADNAQSVTHIGLILATSAAVSIGVTALPLPFTDIGSDWLVYEAVPLATFDAASLLTSGAQNGSVQTIEIDGKAMRKYDNNMALMVVAQNTVRSSTHTIEISGTLRVLLKHS